MLQGEDGHLQGILPYAQLQTLDRGQVFPGYWMFTRHCTVYNIVCVMMFTSYNPIVGYITLCVIMFTS